MEYGYVRVSSTTQNVARQVEELKKLNITKNQIFIDKQSGKDFERTAYKNLISILKPNDLVIVKSIDRLGRNYQMIVEEWTKITKVIGADIFVIDMPILDTRSTPNNLVGRFISDLVLQLLSFVAENERDNIKSRQAEGIKIAQARGVKFGRPLIKLNKEKMTIINAYFRREITAVEATRRIGVSKGTFFKLIKQINEEKAAKMAA